MASRATRLCNEISPPAAAPRYEVEVAECFDALRSVEAEWRELLARAPLGSSFFAHPAHVVHALQLSPRARPWVLLIRNNGQLCCVAPFQLLPTRLRIQFSVLTLAAPAVRMLKSFGGEFVVDADADADECCDLAFQQLWGRRAEYDLIWLDLVREAGPLWRHCFQKLPRSTRFRPFLASSQVDAVHQIVLPPTHEEFMATRSYQTRRRVRRYTRLLERQANVQLECITRPDQMPDFLDRMDEVHRDSWQATHGDDGLRRTAERDKYFTAISEAGLLRSYLLVSDRRPIAFALGYQYDGVYYFAETGYSKEWSKCSPGIVLLHLLVTDLFRRDKPRVFDSILGDQAYKRSFSNSQHGAAAIFIAPPSRWAHVLRGQRALHAMSRWAVAAARSLGLERAARKLVGSRV